MKQQPPPAETAAPAAPQPPPAATPPAPPAAAVALPPAGAIPPVAAAPPLALAPAQPPAAVGAAPRSGEASPFPEDALASLGGDSPPLGRAPQAGNKAGAAASTLARLLSPATLKMGVAVMLIFILVSGLPVDALTAKISYLKRIPFSTTAIKALAAGLAAATVSSNVF